ncbi:MAG: Eco29kI family restriction endonuclease [Rhizobiaceae bacterium]
MTTAPYNPLDKFNLAKSIESELLARMPISLSEVAEVKGAGIYVLYYTGNFKPYSVLSNQNQKGIFSVPIYIGKAIPKGGRKGGFANDLKAVSGSKALAERLGQHAQSIRECENLSVDDFFVRYLVVDDIWIPLGENMLIERFKPVWNRAIDGFGNKDPGKRRKTQYKSPWDVVHPGRLFSIKLADSPLSVNFLYERVEDYFAGKVLAKLPKKVAGHTDGLEEDEEDDT